MEHIDIKEHCEPVYSSSHPPYLHCKYQNEFSERMYRCPMFESSFVDKNFCYWFIARDRGECRTPSALKELEVDEKMDSI